MAVASGMRKPPVRWLILAAVVLTVVVVVIMWRYLPVATRNTVAAPTVTATPAPTAAPTAVAPKPGEFAANRTDYDVQGLPRVDVFAVLPDLPVDSSSSVALPATTARAIADLVPVFADPSGAPVATLPREDVFEGTTVVVMEKQTSWARVMLTGRSAVPSVGQLTGWVRAQDVTFATLYQSVDVNLTARTIDIVNVDGSRERVTDDFGSGAPETPTPEGATFLMLVHAEPSLEYTQGHPIVYLAEQSRTLAGFDGLDVAVTAFHYHDTRSGAVSNGCLRLDATAIDRLAQLPLGTPVSIHS